MYLFQLSVMYYNLSIVFILHASVILVTFTFVCRSKSPTGLRLFVFTYSTLNKVSMSMSVLWMN